MTSSQAQTIQWSEDKYKKLEGQLEGFWVEDEWDMSQCPLVIEKLTKRLGKLKFEWDSKTLAIEIKYACWRKFESGEWSMDPTTISRLNQVFKWLSKSPLPTQSIVEMSLNKWEADLLSYLVENGRVIISSTTQKINRYQEVQKYKRTTDGRIGLFRQLYKVIKEAYDERPEYDKDIWDFRKLNVPLDLSNSQYKLNFTKLSQVWLLQAAKKFMRYNLAIHSAADCQSKLKSLNTFSRFITEFFPSTQPLDIDRKLVVEYLSYLASTSLSAATRTERIIHLRIFFRLSAREGWADVPEKELIYNEDMPQKTTPLPRCIPPEVLDQLNQHIDGLPPQIMRMVLIQQECGRRINEICLMPFDCLIQDAHGDCFLVYNNSKIKEQASIPISKETAAVIREQQEFVLKEWEKQLPYLFPQPKPRGKGEPIKQSRFGDALNRLAYDKKICDSTGKIWRFQSHQFRHTVATKMVNLGVPIHIIKRYMKHRSFGMTIRYTNIHDQTLKEEFAKFRDKMVDVTGKVVSYESVATEIASGSDPNNIDAQWLKKNIRAQALPNGLCGLPVNQPVCPYGANKCLTGPDGKGCSHFKTDTRYYDKHKEHLARTNEIVEWAQENPDSRRSQEVLKLNLPVKENLEGIITTLESQQNAQQ